MSDHSPEGAEGIQEPSKSSPATFSPEQLAELNRVMRGILRKELPQKSAEPASVEDKTLTQQVKALQQKLADAELRESNERKQNHILQTLSKHKVQYPDKAAKLIADKFSVKDGQVVALDEYGELINSDKIVEDFLNELPIFKPPREMAGTAKGGSSQGRNGPHSPANVDMNSESGSSKIAIDSDMIKRLGPEKARILGLI